MSRFRARVWLLAAALLATGAGAAAVYGGRLHDGLFYDDYHFARPLSAIEFRRVWYGSWDPTGIESMFYRPLAAWLFAARFWLFGVNAPLMHAVGIAGHVLCATLVVAVLRREGATRVVSVVGGWLYAIHPLFPYAQVSWLTNQMHLAESLVVIAALMVWQAVRDRSPVAWWPLVALAVLAFLIKEDGIMLLPALAAATLLRDFMFQRRVSRRSIAVTAAGGVVTIALVAFRYTRLNALGGYGLPDVSGAVLNFDKGLETALFVWPTRGVWQGLACAIALLPTVATFAFLLRKRGRLPALLLVGAAAIVLAVNALSLFKGGDPAFAVLSTPPLASAIVTALLVCGAGMAVHHGDRTALWLIALGVTMAVTFNLPFALVSKREQYHLVTLSAVIAGSGAVLALWPARSTFRLLAAASLIAVVASVPLMLLARGVAADFRPCGPNVVAADRDVDGWWVVPDELKAFVAAKPAECSGAIGPGEAYELPAIAWGAYGQEPDSGTDPYRWTSDRVVMMVRADAISITLAFRRPDATRDRPVVIALTTGSHRTTVTLDSEAWRFTSVNFRRGRLLTWLRAGQRLDVDVTPWFVPAVRDPKSTDLRRFGAEMRIVSVD